MSLPPADAGPHGPTNLEETLLDIAQNSEGDLPKQLLLLTDADAEPAHNQWRSHCFS